MRRGVVFLVILVVSGHDGDYEMTMTLVMKMTLAVSPLVRHDLQQS